MLGHIGSGAHPTMLNLLRLPRPTSQFMLVQLNIGASPLDRAVAGVSSGCGRLGRFCSGDFVDAILEVHKTGHRASQRLGQPRAGSKSTVLEGSGALQASLGVDRVHPSAESEMLLAVLDQDSTLHVVELLVPRGTTVRQSHGDSARAVSVSARLLTGAASGLLSPEQTRGFRRGVQEALSAVGSSDRRRRADLQPITAFFVGPT